MRLLSISPRPLLARYANFSYSALCYAQVGTQGVSKRQACRFHISYCICCINCLVVFMYARGDYTDKVCKNWINCFKTFLHQPLLFFAARHRVNSVCCIFRIRLSRCGFPATKCLREIKGFKYIKVAYASSLATTATFPALFRFVPVPILFCLSGLFH